MDDGGAQNTVGVNASALGEEEAAYAELFRAQGMLRVNGVLGSSTCAHLREHLDANLAEAQAMLPAGGNGENRWDMFLKLTPLVLAAITETITPLRPLLDRLFAPDAALCELSALVSDSGAPRQPLHFDTGLEPNAPLLMTCFIAMQDITDDMGPTVMLPCSVSAAAHQQLTHADEAALGNILGSTATVGDLQLPAVRCTLKAGDVALMDSRLLHCGGANTTVTPPGTAATATRRRLLYYTMCEGGGKQLPRGASYSMFPVYRDKLRLGFIDDWADHMDYDIQPAEGLATTPQRKG